MLGHLQQGGAPSQFDRIQATGLVARCVAFLIAQAAIESGARTVIGLYGDGRHHDH